MMPVNVRSFNLGKCGVLVSVAAVRNNPYSSVVGSSKHLAYVTRQGMQVGFCDTAPYCFPFWDLDCVMLMTEGRK